MVEEWAVWVRETNRKQSKAGSKTHQRTSKSVHGTFKVVQIPDQMMRHTTGSAAAMMIDGSAALHEQGT